MNTSEIIASVSPAAAFAFQKTAAVIPQEFGWINDFGVVGCLVVGIIALFKDRSQLLKELTQSREKYEAHLKDLADRPDERPRCDCDNKDS